MITEQIQNQIIHGDFYEELPKIRMNTVDMILTDLPYNVTQNKWDIKLDLSKMWLLFYHVLKDDGIVVLTAKQSFTTTLINSNKDWFKYEIIWNKLISTGFLNANKMPLQIHENVLIFYKKTVTYNPQFTIGKKSHAKGKMNLNTNNNYGEFIRVDKTEEQGTKKFPVSIINIKRPHITNLHPTQKPIELFEYLIKTYTNEGDSILDCCAGSGTTAIACLNTNRNYFCIEKDKEYFNVMKNRITQHLSGSVSS